MGGSGHNSFKPSEYTRLNTEIMNEQQDSQMGRYNMWGARCGQSQQD